MRRCSSLGGASWRQVQEVARDAVVVGGCLDAFAVGVEPVPVQQHGWEGGEQAVGSVALPREVRLGLKVAQHRAARAQHVHGVRFGRYGLQRLFQLPGEAAQRLQLVAVGGEVTGVGQVPVMQQVSNFLEAGVFGQIVDVEASIGEARTLLAHRADFGPAGDNARQATGLAPTHFANGRKG